MPKKSKIPNTLIDDIYFKKLRNLSGAEKMKRMFEMCDFMWRVVEESIRNEFPDISDTELKTKLKQRLRE